MRIDGRIIGSQISTIRTTLTGTTDVLGFVGDVIATDSLLAHDEHCLFGVCSKKTIGDVVSTETITKIAGSAVDAFKKRKFGEEAGRVWIRYKFVPTSGTGCAVNNKLLGTSAVLHLLAMSLAEERGEGASCARIDSEIVGMDVFFVCRMCDLGWRLAAGGWSRDREGRGGGGGVRFGIRRDV